MTVIEAMRPDIITVEGKKEPGETLISHDKIMARLRCMAPEIADVYQGVEVIGLTVMQGAMVVSTHLQHELHRAGMRGLQMDSIRARSYGDGTESSGEVQIIHDMSIDPAGRHVLIIEDIVDTALTLSLLEQLLQQRGAASVNSFALVSKLERRRVEYKPRFSGFQIPNVWIQGFGMDTDEYGREHPDIILGPVKP